jgi:hypothetical protein
MKNPMRSKPDRTSFFWDGFVELDHMVAHRAAAGPHVGTTSPQDPALSSRIAGLQTAHHSLSWRRVRGGDNACHVLGLACPAYLVIDAAQFGDIRIASRLRETTQQGGLEHGPNLIDLRHLLARQPRDHRPAPRLDHDQLLRFQTPQHLAD